LDGGTTRVLVFDPDPVLCEAITTALNGRNGFEVVTATSALEAGAVAEELKPHVVIADVTQLDATPAQITRFLRSRPSSQVICLIGMATGMSEAQGQSLLQQGFDAYLSKPFDVRTLRELIGAKANTSISVDTD